jgi:enamine deaminase RidA (YjgF/YER057c/UK114 family)
MSGAVDAVREILTLTENVRGLRDDVARLTSYVNDLRERLVRLEAREEVVVEKTRNAAIVAVNRMNGELIERIVALELALKPLLTSDIPTPRLRAASVSASASEDSGA